MEIKNIEKGILDQLAPRGAREEAPTERRPRPDQARERRETTQPVAPRRPPPLVTTVSRSLAQSGLAVPNANAVPAPGDANPDQIASGTATDSRQAERAAEALQAFMHSLVKAVNAAEVPATSGLARTSAQAPVAQVGDTAPPDAPAANAYQGLVSRLEGLVQALSGDQSSSRSNQELARLDSAFRDLRSLSAGSNAESGADLQTVLKNMIRNLQSTGDPTLASTGNVINTAA